LFFIIDQRKEIMAFSINLEDFKEEVLEAAKKGAKKEIQEYFTGYGSPFRKKVQESLESIKIEGCITLPNILTEIQKALEEDIQMITSNSIAYTGIRSLNHYLGLEKKQIDFEDMLTEFVNTNFNEFDDDYDSSDFSVEIEKKEYRSWYDVILVDGKGKEYSFTLHEFDKKDTQGNKLIYYRLLSYRKYKSYKENSTTPFTFTDEKGNKFEFYSSSILNDKFATYLFSLSIGATEITFDRYPTSYSFDDITFPGEDCHC